jgi:predicted choloylglycine hydrolase
LALNLTLLDAQSNYTLDDLVSYFVATENSAKEGKRVKELNRVLDANHSVALKAKAVQYIQEHQVIEEEDEMTSTSDTIMWILPYLPRSGT